MESRTPVLLTPHGSAREGTFFSQERFIQAITRTHIPNARVLKVQSPKSPACIFGLERSYRFNKRSALLAPFGLSAYPIGGDGSPDCASLLVAELKSLQTVEFEWNVRFDHGVLANDLERCGLNRCTDTTHVLYLDQPYDALFRGFSQTTRNQIRSAERKGVVVSPATQNSDIAAYYALYEEVIRKRERWGYKRSLFEELFKLVDDVIFLVVRLDSKMIGGGWFIRDGNSLCYWQSAMDYQFQNYFPVYAMINFAIRLACNESFESFNMGASIKISSLEQFKSFWGARKTIYWTFTWQNPVWATTSRIRKAFHGR